MRLLGLFFTGVLLCAAQSAAAAVVIMPADTDRATLEAWGAPRPVLEPRDNPYTAGPVALGDGVVFSSTTGASLLGFTGSYNFAGHGAWQSDALPMAGVNEARGGMSFNFATPVSAIIAQTNWAAATAGSEPVTISIYNDADILLETLVITDGKVDFQTSGSYLGFIRPTADIARITFSNGFIGARDFFSRYTSNSFGDDGGGAGGGTSAPPSMGGPLGPEPPILGGAVPEPSTWALMLVGFGAVGTLLRGSRRRTALA